MKKKTKFSLGMKIVTLLTVITMASVGFAAWVITAPVTAQEKAGAIKVETVRSETISIAAKFATFIDGELTDTNEAQQIVYGVPNDYNPNDSDWLINDNAANFKENLVVYLHIHVINNSTIKDANINLLLNAFVGDKTNDKTNVFVSAIDKTDANKFIAAPQFTLCDIDGRVNSTPKTFNVDDPAEPIIIGTVDKKVNEEDEENTADFYVKIEFDWGKAVNNDNAFTYYNEFDYSTDRESAATTYLNGLYETLNGLSYLLTIGA